MVKVFRPTLDDVERISLGKGARKRGTGSRYVCHRLNQDERRLYEQAKQNNYLMVKGTAYRRERKGSPVCNTFRQRCDALEQICIIIEKHSFGDRIKIDLSTLRVQDDAGCVSQIWTLLSTKYPDLISNVQDQSQGLKINWDDVQKNPIWDVKERLIVIECDDRLVVKSLAEDLLKESLQFEEHHENIDEDQNKDTIATTKEHNIDGIDWNDI